MDQGDLELLDRWRRGDGSAFESLVRRWQQPLARFLVRLADGRGAVDDLRQEVFLRAYRSAGRFRGEAEFSTWLYRIAVNVVRDERRRDRRRGQAAESTNGFAHSIEPSDPTLPPDQELDRREQGRAVAAALAELPEALRTVIVLKHYEQLNFEQIARILEAPASTIKSRFAVGMNALRKRLGSIYRGPDELA